MSESPSTASAEVDPVDPSRPDAASDDAEPSEPSPEALARERRVAELAEILRVEEGQGLERAYLFEPLERRDVAFRLVLVVKRIGEARLEMVAIGARAVGTETPIADFVRRATFPDPVLPSILEEFIDRCGVEGAIYREATLTDVRTADDEPVEPLDALADRLYPA